MKSFPRSGSPRERFDAWMERALCPSDKVVIEMTTNTWDVYDALLPNVHSVCVVHSPHVKAVTSPQVMTDKIAARILAKLLAAGLLVSIWTPPPEVRQLRALAAEYHKMSILGAQAKQRLHATLHRHRIVPEEGVEFSTRIAVRGGISCIFRLRSKPARKPTWRHWPSRKSRKNAWKSNWVSGLPVIHAHPADPDPGCRSVDRRDGPGIDRRHPAIP